MKKHIFYIFFSDKETTLDMSSTDTDVLLLSSTGFGCRNRMKMNITESHKNNPDVHVTKMKEGIIDSRKCKVKDEDRGARSTNTPPTHVLLSREVRCSQKIRVLSGGGGGDGVGKPTDHIQMLIDSEPTTPADDVLFDVIP